MKLLSRKELEELLMLSLKQPYILVTLHPETLAHHSIEEQFTPLAKALLFFPESFILFTKGNSDTGGSRLNQLVEDFIKQNKERACCFTSLGTLAYLSLMSHSQMVAGNSSSGIIQGALSKNTNR